MLRLTNIVLPLSCKQCTANMKSVLWHPNVTLPYPQDEVNLKTSSRWQRNQMDYTGTCELSLFSFPKAWIDWKLCCKSLWCNLMHSQDLVISRFVEFHSCCDFMLWPFEL